MKKFINAPEDVVREALAGVAAAHSDLRVDLENGPQAVEATLFRLVDGEYQVAAQSVDGVLRSSLPWPFEADLRALASGRRQSVSGGSAPQRSEAEIHRWDD